MIVDLDEIEARANAATPGPFKAGRDGWRAQVWLPNYSTWASVAIANSVDPDADVAFLVSARADVRALVAELRAARVVIAEAKRMRRFTWVFAHDEDDAPPTPGCHPSCGAIAAFDAAYRRLEESPQ